MLDQPSPKSKPDSATSPHARLPRIGITVGDVAGIGPEIALRCAADTEILTQCQPVLIAPPKILRRVAHSLMNVTHNEYDWVSFVDQHKSAWVTVGQLDAESVVPGSFTPETGRASYDAVVWATRAAQSGELDAIVTGPIQKEAWHDAGIPFPGHTELLAELTHTADVRMMLTAESISCVLVTIHIPLADVARELTVDAIVRSIVLGAEAVKHRSCGDVRVTVCGLNPHAGENGMFSHGEEQNVITPAIEAARRPGIVIVGPVPPDTAFTPAMRAKTDVYVCMYHDQGLIPLKAIAFDDAVNVTLGLPIVRTSVDHGTALDIAWRGLASHSSMLAATRMAASMCKP